MNQIPAVEARQQFLWSNGDTTESITIKHPGQYELTISNQPLGCSSSATIAVRKDCYLDIPNAFTPNGDGFNDYFFPMQLLSSGISVVHLQIRNRWGRLLYETRQVDGRGWDGRYNGIEQPEGVYLYRLELMAGDGRELFQGNITLMR